MIEIFPGTYNRFTCPSCKGNDVALNKTIFQGIHLLADLECKKCGFTFYQDFPVGHGVTYPAIIDKKNLQVLSPANMDWFTKPLVESLQKPNDQPVTISKKVNGNAGEDEPVIFFNCLDAWYGHVLLKLLNLQFYHDKFPAYKKIVLVPAGFSWMVPSYANEIWTTSIKLRETTAYYLQLENFIREELKRYKTVYHSTGYSHPPLQKVRVQDFFQSPAFNLDNFSSTPPKILFVYREDRLWIKPFWNKLFNFLNHRKIKFAHSFFYGLQAGNINKLAKKVKSLLPSASFYVCGLGKQGKLWNGIVDERAVAPSEQQELAWCKLYAQTHIAIGIHGSNMLIPSALSAGFIEILPNDRNGNISQDLFCKYAHNQMVYLGRFVSMNDSANDIAAIAQSMISEYESFSNHQVHNYDVNK